MNVLNIGGVQGTAFGVVEGPGKGRRSLPAAALTSAAIGRQDRAGTTRQAKVPNGN